MNQSLSPVPATQQLVFNLFDCIRGEVSADAYTIVPALLVLGRLPIFTSLLAIWAENEGSLAQYAASFDQDSQTDEVEALQEYVRTISQFRAATQHQLLNVLHKLNLPARSQVDFEGLFDYALEQSLGATSRADRGQFTLPKELIQLVASICAVQPGERVFNPYAGTALLINYLEPASTYIAQEADSRLRSLAALRLLVHSRSPADVIVGDGLLNPWPDNTSWHVICSVLPLIPVPRSNQGASIRPGASRVQVPFEFAFIHEALKHLSEDGRAVIVVPQGILKHATSHRFRQQLIDQDWLESVIGLPAGILLPYASVSLAVLVFRVNKEHRGAVRFIDASISTVSTQDRRQLLNVAQVLDLLKQSGDSQYVRLASHSQIAANGYDLLPYHYTTILATSPDDANLAQFTKIIKTGVSEAPTPDTPTITIKKMRADNLRFEVNLNGLMPYSAVPESYRKGVYLTEPALLLTLSSTSLRPAWYPATDKTGLFVPRNIVALHLDTQKVDIAYLVTELNSSYVTQQIEYLVSGSVIPIITWSALEQLRVRLPSLLEQRAAVARQTSAKLDEQELVQSKQSEVRKDEAYKDFASFKHAFVQPLFAMQSDVEVIQQALRRQAELGQPVDLNDSLSQRKQYSLNDVFASLARNFAYIQQLMKRQESILRVEEHLLTPIELVPFLTEFQKHRQIQATNFNLILELPSTDLEASQFPLEIKANAHLLETLLHYVISNAAQHGFQERPPAQNTVLIELVRWGTPEKPQVKLTVANTGAPFPSDFTKEDYTRLHFTTGNKQNSGIGGDDINKITSYMGGEFELVAYARPEYPVSVVFFFPLSN